ncbi:MAG: hypothetical protein ACK4N5_24470, partial [Myxococcales bacterium]
MQSFSPQDQRRLRDVVESARRLQHGERPYLEQISSELNGLLRSEKVCSYGVSGDEGNYTLDFMFGSGFSPAAAAKVTSDFFATHSTRWGAFDPSCPEPRQRNRVFRLSQMQALIGTAVPVNTILYPRLGFYGLDNVRVLVCEGGSLLAWVGAFRREPFTARELRLLAAITP